MKKVLREELVLLIILSLLFSLIYISYKSMYVKDVAPNTYVYSDGELKNYYKDYILNNDSDAYDFSFEFYNPVIIKGLNNLSQYRLNKEYNKKYNENISGTCAIVAVTEIILKYRTDLNEMDVFAATVSKAREIGAFVDGNGTLNYKIDNLLNAMFNYYAIDKTAENHRFYNIQNKAIEFLDQGNEYVLNLPGHATVCYGYINCKVKYKTKHKSWFIWGEEIISEEEYNTKVLLLNDGFEDGESLAKYYPVSRIGGIFDYVLTCVK